MKSADILEYIDKEVILVVTAKSDSSGSSVSAEFITSFKHSCSTATFSDATETFEIDGTALVICRFRDEYFALENLCSHALSTFDEGRMRAYRIMCPLHGATFDIRDGSCTGAPATKPIRSYPVRITAGMVEVNLSSQAR